MATQLTEAPTRRSITATRPLMGWRTVDLLTVAFLGAALGVAFWGWGVFYNGPVTALKIGYAPLMGLFVGPWFLAGVVGGLVVRRPGAALFCEVVAALVSMLPGTEWGATVLVSGILQGLGAELAFAILGYSAFGAVAAALAGVLSAPLEWAFEVVKFPASWADVPVLSVLANGGGWYAEWVLRDKLVYLGAMAVSGRCSPGSSAGCWCEPWPGRARCRRSPPARSTGSSTLSDAATTTSRGRVEVDGLTWRPFGRREPVLRDVVADPATGRAGAARRAVRVGQVDPAPRARRAARDGRRR